MTLQAYLQAAGMSQTEFSRKVGVSVATISRLISGKAKPSYDIMLKIREVSSGTVTANDFFPPTKGRVKRVAKLPIV